MNIHNSTKIKIFLLTILFIVSPICFANLPSPTMPELSQSQSRSQPQSKTISGQAVIKSRNEVEISSQIDGKIDKINFREGDFFKKGETIIAFDCRLYQADYKKAKAEFEKYKSQYKSNQKLRNLGGLSEQDFAQSKGDYEQSKANTEAKAVIVEQCKIIAPFSGSVSKLHVNNHQTVKTGQLLVELVDSKNLEVEMLLPSTAMRYVKIGKIFTFTTDDTQETFQAKITKIVPKIDPISKTIKVIGIIENDQGKLLAGMSGIGVVKQSIES